MKLAQSLWPRSGGDPGNRGVVSVEGPSAGVVVWSETLPRRTRLERGHDGLIVGTDGLLRVVFSGQLSSVYLGSRPRIRWSLRLRADHHNSLPLALDDGGTIIATDEGLEIADESGNIGCLPDCDMPLDDSGPSPCITHGGILIATSPLGGVSRFDGDTWTNLKISGYDVLPPAVFDDDSLAIAGYYGSGFCRVRLDGSMVWESGFLQADLLPSISMKGDSAVGSLNDEQSRFFDKDGNLLGTYPAPAVFAAYPSGRWVALSEGRVAMLERDGSMVWSRDVRATPGWGTYQPILDSLGNIFVPCLGGVLSLTGAGEFRFSTDLGQEAPGTPAIVGPQSMALIYDGRLLLIK